MKMLIRDAISILMIIGSLLFIPARAMAENRVDSCQCTDYVYSQRQDIPTGMGHAKDWLYSARVYRIPYDQVPQVGDVVVILHGEFGFSTQFGHVAMVTEVNEDRTAFSIAGWDGFKNDCRLQVFHNLPVTNNTYFIHQIIKNETSTAPYLDWPHPNQGFINLELIEF
jgi:sporulation protein YlmC with PRC-barrel domain